MAQQDRATLKSYFNAGDVPTEAQFADLIDSLRLSGDLAPVATSGAHGDLTGAPTVPANVADLADVDGGAAAEGYILVLRSGSHVYEAKPAAGSNPAIGDITDWPASVSATEVGYLDGASSAIQAQIDGKAATGHGHTLADISDAGTAAAAATGDFATAAQGALADTALQPATGMMVVNHGATAGTARPAGAASVYWIGSVAPTNAVESDQWYDTGA